MSRNYMNSEAFRDQVSRDLRSDAEFERRQRENRLTAAPDLLSAARFALNYLEDHAIEMRQAAFRVEYAASCDAAVEGLRAAITAYLAALGQDDGLVRELTAQADYERAHGGKIVTVNLLLSAAARIRTDTGGE